MYARCRSDASPRRGEAEAHRGALRGGAGKSESGEKKLQKQPVSARARAAAAAWRPNLFGSSAARDGASKPAHTEHTCAADGGARRGVCVRVGWLW